MYDLLLNKRRFLSWSKNTLKSKVNVIYILVGFYFLGGGVVLLCVFLVVLFWSFLVLFFCFS